jgi:hypothetical protein
VAASPPVHYIGYRYQLLWRQILVDGEGGRHCSTICFRSVGGASLLSWAKQQAGILSTFSSLYNLHVFRPHICYFHVIQAIFQVCLHFALTVYIVGLVSLLLCTGTVIGAVLYRILQIHM